MNTFATRDVNDIWKVAQSVQNDIATSGGSLSTDKYAFTVLASQYDDTYFHSRVCVKDYGVLPSVASNNLVPTGTALIL